MSEYVPTTEEVEIAAKLMWKERALGTTTPDYPWRGLAEEGRERLREHAREVLTVALAARDAEVGAKTLEEAADLAEGVECIVLDPVMEKIGKNVGLSLAQEFRSRAAEYRKAVE